MPQSYDIIIKRGYAADLDELSLDPGQIATTIDTGELYLGDENGAVQPARVAVQNLIGLTSGEAEPDPASGEEGDLYLQYEAEQV